MDLQDELESLLGARVDVVSWKPAQQVDELISPVQAAFDADWARQRAAERLLEIIGEASNAL